MVLVPMRMRILSADQRRPDYIEMEERKELRETEFRYVQDVAGLGFRRARNRSVDFFDRSFRIDGEL
jgi:hypothetical protein